MKSKSFVSGVLTLIIAGLITRLLGFVYRVYLSNLIGAEGMGLFQLIFPIYSLIILTLTSGISISVSKMVSEQVAVGNHSSAKKVMKYGLIIVVTAGIFVSTIMLLYAKYISASIMNDSRTYYSLLILIPCIPIIAGSSAIKGFFYGLQEMVPTAISQITEQIVRMTFVIFAASYFINVSIEYSCAIATAGMTLGEIANLLTLLVAYRLKKLNYRSGNIKLNILKRVTIIKDLLKMSIPISINRLVTSSMSAFEAVLIPSRLLLNGLSHQQSLAVFGKLTGMTMPVLFFPTLVTSALATTLVPAISNAVSTKNFKLASYRISKSIQISLALGFVFFAILMSYPDEISKLVYKRENIGEFLYALSFSCIFLYLQQTLLGILNGLGKQTISLINSIIGNLIRIGFAYFCIPHFGIMGYIWGIIVSAAINSTLNLILALKTISFNINIKELIFRPLFIGIVMVCISKYVYSFIDIFVMSSKLKTLLSICGCLLIAVYLVVVTGIMQKSELKRLLGLDKIRKSSGYSSEEE